MKIKALVHNDLDAVGAVLVLRKIYGKDSVDAEYCNHTDIDKRVKDYAINESDKYSKLYIVDIGVSESTANFLSEYLFNKVELVDHHKTNLFLNNYHWARVQVEDNGELISATKLLYNIKLKNHTGVFKDLIEVINRWDTWLWKTKYNDDRSKLLNELLYMVGRDRFIEICDNIVESGKYEIPEREMYLLDLKQEEFERYLEKTNECIIKRKFGDYYLGVVFAEKFKSELGNALHELNQELDAILIIDFRSAMSLRSTRMDVDVAEIAKEIGDKLGLKNGGHKSASGVTFNDNVRLSILNKFL